MNRPAADPDDPLPDPDEELLVLLEVLEEGVLAAGATMLVAAALPVVVPVPVPVLVPPPKSVCT
ncbi:hypothetical protein D3C80_1561580 [compost metagenome]